MVQATQDGARDDPNGRAVRGPQRRGTGKRRHQPQAGMRPIGVVEGDVLPEHALEVPRVEHEHVVEALLAQRPDDPLGDRVRRRGPERRQEGVDPERTSLQQTQGGPV